MTPRDETVAPAGGEPRCMLRSRSAQSWVVGIKSPSGARIGLHTLRASDTDGLRDLIERHRTKAERAPRGWRSVLLRGGLRMVGLRRP